MGDFGPEEVKMLTTRRWVFVAAALSLALGSASASAATVVFDNFGAEDTYNPYSSSPLSGKHSTIGEYEYGWAFTPSASGFLSDVWAAAGLVNGENNVTFTLQASVGGVPGDVLWSNQWLNAMGPLGNMNPPLHWSGNGPLLEAGAEYYLVGSGGDTTWAGWNANSIGAQGVWVVRQGGGDWIVAPPGTQDTFRIAVNVPEPAALVLLGAALLVLRRR